MIAYDNQDEFVAFCMNFLRTFRSVYISNEGNEIENYVSEMENRLSNIIVPGIASEIRSKKISDTRGRRTVVRNMEREAQEFLNLYESLLQENGLADEPEQPIGQ